MSSLRDSILSKYGVTPPGASPADKSTPAAGGSSTRETILAKYNVSPAAAPAAPTNSSLRETILAKYSGATGATGPAAPSQVHFTPPDPVVQQGLQSLSLAFPHATANSTPMLPVKGESTIDFVKAATGALISIPKTLYDNQVHPDAEEQQIEHFTNVGEGTPLAPITAIPNFAKNVAMRFINPVLKPFAEDVATAIAGNLPDSNPLAIRKSDLLYTPVMQKSATQIVGDTAQAVLAAYSPGVLGKTAVGVAGSPIKTALLTGAKAGAEQGLYFGVAQAASSGSKDPTEIGRIVFLNVTGGAILGAVTSGAVPVAKEGYQALTKDIIKTYNMPERVYIEPDKIRSIFQTGDRISPEELQLVKELGLTTSEYKTAIKNGVTIEVPAENLTTIADKPYWAKIKGFFGLEPFSETTGTVAGKPRQAPYGYLTAGEKSTGTVDTAAQKARIALTEQHVLHSEGLNIDEAIAKGDIPAEMVYQDQAKGVLTPQYAEGRITDVAQKLDGFQPGLGDQFRAKIDPSNTTMQDIELLGQETLKSATSGYGTTVPLLEGKSTTPEEFNRQIEAPKTVTAALTKAITPGLLARISAFDKPEASAFGRNLIQQITEAAGLDAPGAANVQIPKNVDAINTPSGDGRPAQFNNGRIELFIPNIVEDIVQLAKGGTIEAHEGVHTTIYKKLDGESFEDLALRYVQDIILHEAAHQKTMTLADTTKTQTLSRAIQKAKIERNEPALISARQELTAHMKDLEVRANDYLKTNREALAAEYLQPAAQDPALAGAPRAINKFEREALGIPPDKILTRTERSLLKARIKARAQGSREGFVAGKQAGAEKAKEQLKSSYEKVIETIRNRQASQLERRRALIDYAQILPFRERGKFLKAINNTKTDLEMERVIERIRKASRSSERAVLIKAIVKEMKETVVKKRDGLPNAKFAYDQQKALNEIRAVQKNVSYAEAHMKIAELVSDFATKNPDEPFPTDLIHQIEILKMAGLKDQSVSELADTLSAIQSIKETGRTQKELERFNRETDVQQMRDKVYDTITGGKPLPSEDLSIKTRRAKKEAFFKQYARESLFGWEELLDKMSQQDKASKPYESFLSRFGQDKADASFNAQNRGEIKSIGEINSKMKEIYGVEKKGDILALLGDLQKQHNLGDVPHTDGKSRLLELSRGEAMQYWMWHQDDALDTTFAETLHWGDEVWSKIDSLLTDKDKQMAQALLDWYAEYYKGVNAVFAKEYGVDLPFNPNYSPVHRAIDIAIPENVLLAQESAKYATAKNGSLKDRVKNQIDLKATDAFQNVTRHIVKMEHYKAWSDTMFNFRRVFGDKQVRTAIADFVGEPYLKITDNFLNDMARDGVSREKLVPWVDKLRKNATQALLGLNLKVGIKQLTGVLNYGIEIPTGPFLSGLTSFWTDPIGHASFLFDKSPTLQERFGEGFERDLKFAIEKGYDKKLAKANNLNEIMFVPIRNADKVTVYMGSWAAYRWAYKDAIKAGKTAAEAEAEGIRQAENITNRVQESSRLDTLAPLQREGSWAKLFTMFQSQPSKYLRIMMNAGRNYRAGRTSAATAAKRIAWAWFIVPFFYNLVADQFIDPKYRESSGGLITRTLLGPLTEPLIVGQMVQQIYGWTQGETFDYQPSAVFGFMDDILKSIQQFNSSDAVDGTSYILDAAGKLTGVPSTIVTKPVRNANKDSQAGGSAPSGSF